MPAPRSARALARRLFLFAVLACAAVPPGAQPADAPRPRLGLALGGGGAHGFAHVGVLRWLEENHIPVHAIAGTSAGGLIGGMYAAGMSPAEIHDAVARISWEDVLRGAPAYRDLLFRRKEEAREYPIKVEFGARKGLTLPGGLNPGHALGLQLCRYCLPYSTLDDFDQLPTPFRCVATDMLTARPVVLRDGCLAQALRATMAIPGVFTLVERDGATLADGGLVDLLPVDVAQQMGAQIVVAVDVSVPVYDPGALRSLPGTIAQAISVMQERNAQANRERADTPPNIRVDLRQALRRFSSADYAAFDRLEQSGYDTLQHAPELAARLRQYRVSDLEWADYLAQRARRRRGAEMVPAFVECRVEGGAPGEARYIEGKLARHCGVPLDVDRLEADLTGVAGWGPYESLSYEKARRGAQEGLRVSVLRKPHGPPFLRPGLTIDGAEWDNMRFSLGARMTGMDARGSEWRVDAGVGAHTRLGAEYLHRLKRRGWFVAPRLFYDRSAHDLFRDHARLSEFHLQQAGAGVDLGYDFGRQSEMRAGLEAVAIVQSLHTGDPMTRTPDGAATSAFARYTLDTSDDAVLPARGARATMEGRWFFAAPGAGGSFGQAQADITAFKPLSRTSTLFFRAAGGSTFERQAPLAQQFTLGGPLRLTGYYPDELRGSHFLLLGGGWLQQVYQLPGAFGQKVCLGGWYERGSVFESLHAARFGNSLSAGIIADTMLGALAVGASWADGGRARLFFSLGRFF